MEELRERFMKAIRKLDRDIKEGKSFEQLLQKRISKEKDENERFKLKNLLIKDTKTQKLLLFLRKSYIKTLGLFEDEKINLENF